GAVACPRVPSEQFAWQGAGWTLSAEERRRDWSRLFPSDSKYRSISPCNKSLNKGAHPILACSRVSSLGTARPSSALWNWPMLLPSGAASSMNSVEENVSGSKLPLDWHRSLACCYLTNLPRTSIWVASSNYWIASAP